MQWFFFRSCERLLATVYKVKFFTLYFRLTKSRLGCGVSWDLREAYMYIYNLQIDCKRLIML